MVVSKRELIMAGCRILDDSGGKIIVSCPQERFESEPIIRDSNIENVKRDGDDIRFTLQKDE